MKKKNITIVICRGICGLLVLLSPILVAWGVTAHIPALDKINDTTDWIGFWGCYIGAVITAVAAFGLWMVQRKFDKKQEVLPVVNVCQINGVRPKREADYYVDYLYREQVLRGWVLCDPQNITVKEEVEKIDKWFHTSILIESIGKGAVMNLYIDIKGEEYIRASDEFAICLKEGDCARYNIYIEAEKLKKNSQENELIFRFKDVYDNEYEQSIKFGIYYKTGKNGNHILNENVKPNEWELTYFNPISTLRDKGGL